MTKKGFDDECWGEVRQKTDSLEGYTMQQEAAVGRTAEETKEQNKLKRDQKKKCLWSQGRSKTEETEGWQNAKCCREVKEDED